MSSGGFRRPTSRTLLKECTHAAAQVNGQSHGEGQHGTARDDHLARKYQLREAIIACLSHDGGTGVPHIARDVGIQPVQRKELLSHVSTVQTLLADHGWGSGSDMVATPFLILRHVNDVLHLEQGKAHYTEDDMRFVLHDILLSGGKQAVSSRPPFIH